MQVIERTNWRKRVMKDWHDLGVKSQGHFTPGDLVMLYDGKFAKKKMHLAYRGPLLLLGQEDFMVNYTTSGKLIVQLFLGLFTAITLSLSSYKLAIW